MRCFRAILVVILTAVFGFAVAQRGTIRGTVIDDGTGEPMLAVTVVVKGTTTGAVTDFDGKFEINLEPGTYDIQASFISYQTVTISGVAVKADEVTVIDQIRLSEAVAQLEEVVVTAEVIRTNEAALLTVKRRSANLMDGISAANFRKIGDSDAAQAVKRVTGVSVEGGKYVYVRGLGDRYTKTMLNAVDIPGLDPDRNSLQIDIFPTNLIDNMIVLKTALAELPADFTGGVVNIETKDFPEEKIVDVSFGMSFNPSMHLNNDFLNYEGSGTDWLGFDDGLRDLPANARGNIPQPGLSSDQEVFDFNNSFNPVLGAASETSLMDYNLGVTVGNQLSLNDTKKIGYILSATYKSTYEHFDDRLFGEYQIPASADDFELVTATLREGVESKRNVLLGGLAGVALKTPNNKYKLTAMRLQNGESTAAQFNIIDDPEDRATGKSGFTASSDVLTYSERSITNFLLNGRHHFDDKWLVIDWRVSPTISTLDDPDIREAAFSIEQGEPVISAGQAGVPFRSWRFLDEFNIASKVDLTFNLSAFNRDAKFKTGLSHVYKERDYELLDFPLAFFGRQPDFTGDPNEILIDENLYPNEGNAYFTDGNLEPNPNAYEANLTNMAGYLSAEVSPIEQLKAVVGLRVENHVQRHTGRDQDFAEDGVGGNNLDNEKVIDAFDFFPSANLIYALNDEQNLRISYSRTIARPSFKEASFAQILDPISDRIFNGGLFEYEDWDGNLRSTYINNFDLRWELFMKRNQLLSASVFFKTFQDPIELVRIVAAQTTNEFQPRNVGEGRIYGVELEFRKALDFISPTLSNFSVNGNVTFTESTLDMSPTEFNARERFEKEGENVDDSREMAGQAPYVINAGITYENFETSLDAGLFYNVQGETLVVVGSSLFPDVFTEPFHSLNFNLNKRFGVEDQVAVNVSINNILNDVREQFFQNFRAEDQYFDRRSPGTSFGVGLSYSF